MRQDRRGFSPPTALAAACRRALHLHPRPCRGKTAHTVGKTGKGWKGKGQSSDKQKAERGTRNQQSERRRELDLQSKHQRKADKAKEEKTSREDNDSGTVVKRDDQADLGQRRNQEEITEQ